MSDDHISRARKQIQQKIEAQELAKKHELQRRRIEIAGRGVKAYDKKNPVDAALAFKSYLSILEDLKGAPEGGLAPTYFDRAKDMAEMVLVAGVYWDLVKLYDRTTSPEKFREFQGYLSKYIAFSRGMPFQTMCAESLRKYIRDKRAVHRAEFEDAYKMLKNSRCFVVTELEGLTSFETLPRLRGFRDEVLKNHPLGRSFVAWYYRRGPQMASRIAVWPTFMRVSAAKFFDLLGLIARYRF